MKKCSSSSVPYSKARLTPQYRNQEQVNAKFKRVWKATQLAKTVNAEVTLDLQFPTQSNKQGIGFGKYKPNPTVAERRTLITSKALLFSEQKRMAHSITLKQQIVWLQWSENTLPFDFSWKNLINIWSSNYRIIKFVLNALQACLNSGEFPIQAYVICVQMINAHCTIFFRIALLLSAQQDISGDMTQFFSTFNSPCNRT